MDKNPHAAALGSVTSERKKQTSAENGRKGGRPAENSPRVARLEAEAVAVLCPRCGETQPAPDGSEMWTIEDFARVENPRACVSCEKPMRIVATGTAKFS